MSTRWPAVGSGPDGMRGGGGPMTGTQSGVAVTLSGWGGGAGPGAGGGFPELFLSASPAPNTASASFCLLPWGVMKRTS